MNRLIQEKVSLRRGPKHQKSDWGLDLLPYGDSYLSSPGRLYLTGIEPAGLPVDYTVITIVIGKANLCQ